VHRVHIMFICCIEKQRKDEQDGDLYDTAAAAAGVLNGRHYSLDVSGRLNSSGIIQKGEDNTERSHKVCVGPGKRDDLVLFTRRLFAQMYT